MLFRLLDRALSAHLFLRKEEPLTFSRSEPEPDLAMVERRSDDYRSSHPSTAALVIEVAVASVDVDRQKASIYAAAGIPEYWIVNPETASAEVHRQPASEGYLDRQVLPRTSRLESTAVPCFAVDLAPLFPPES